MDAESKPVSRGKTCKRGHDEWRRYGNRWSCAPCKRASGRRYDRGAKGKRRYARYNSGEKGRARNVRHDRTEAGLARYRRYDSTQKGRTRDLVRRTPFGRLYLDMNPMIGTTL